MAWPTQPNLSIILWLSGLANSTEPAHHLVVFRQFGAITCPFPLAHLGNYDVVLIGKTSLVAADRLAMLAPVHADGRADFCDAEAQIARLLQQLRVCGHRTEEAGEGSPRALAAAQRQETVCFQLQSMGLRESAIPKVLPEVLTIPPRREAA